jgi:hypothetical protein
VTRSGFVGKESVAAATRILAEAATSPGAPLIAVRSLGGAVSRVPGDATAYAHRQAELPIVTTVAGPAPALPQALWDRLEPHVSGVYANFLSSAGENVHPPEVHQRLAEVKRRYDPGNLFARNHNVRSVA